MKHRKTIALLILLVATTLLWAGSLTVSSISFSDSLGNPVEDDYTVSSYKIVGKYMPTPSTIKGQFATGFTTIPTTIENLADGDNWKIKVYAYDSNGEEIGQSEETTLVINGNANIDANIIVDVPTLIVEEPVIQKGRGYTKLSDVYDVQNYKLTYTSLSDGTKTEETIEEFPYTTTAISSGRWSVNLSAFDKNGELIASSGNMNIIMGKKGSVKATPILKLVDTTLTFNTTALVEENSYLYLEDEGSFTITANLSPVEKDTKLSYRWYIADDGKWKELEDITGATITSADVDTSSSFSLLCRPVINGKTYRGKTITINSVPELAPTLFVTGTKAQILTADETEIEITTVNGKIGFSLDIPTYYLGKGVKAYYTLDGTKADESSTPLVLGTTISLNEGENTLNILLVDSDSNKKEYSVTVNAKVQTAPVSISITNREHGKDLYATLSTRTEGARIYYTLDGTEPTEDSTLYTEPFKVHTLGDKTKVTIKAVAIKDGYEVSKVTTMSAF